MSVPLDVISPEMLRTQNVRFGVRSARLSDGGTASFSDVLASRQITNQATVAGTSAATTTTEQLRDSWPVDGVVSSSFGPRSLLPGEEWHFGIDIAVPMGTVVRAVADGVVRFAGDTDGYGNRVEILHPDGTVTLYAHNHALLVNPGQQVTKGTAIALAGSSGASTGPHVHFEIQRDGQAIDPLEFLQPKPASQPQPVPVGIESLPVGSLPFGQLIQTISQRYGLDPLLLAAIVQAESNFDRNAVSPAGAKGLMQLMDATAAWLGVTDPFDPVQNLNAGARFLRLLLDQFDGDIELALAAYNAGPGTVQAYAGVPPFPETRSYLHAVFENYRTLLGSS